MKLLLLDKDGTLINPKSGNKFVQSPWDQTPIPNVAETIDRHVSDGWLPVIISNQAGVAAGHKTLEETIQEMRFCLELFPQIKEAYFCPDFKGQICWRVWGDCSEEHRIQYEVLPWQGLSSFRKPDPGMIALAIDIHNPTESLFVGDRPEDENAAEAADIPFSPAHFWRGDIDQT